MQTDGVFKAITIVVIYYLAVRKPDFEDGLAVGIIGKTFYI